MGNRRIVTTDRSGLSVAQVAGSDVYKLLHQVQSVIELGNLGDVYVQLFAEPVDNGRTIDWYVEEDGEVRSLKDLDDVQRQALLSRFGEMIGKLQAYSKSLRGNSSDAYRTSADILEKALTVPDIEGSLYSVAGQPVLANWGFSKGDNEIVDGAQALMKDIQDKLDKIKENIEKVLEKTPAAETLAAEETVPSAETVSEASLEPPLEPTPPEQPPVEPHPVEQPPVQQPAAPTPAPRPASSASWIAAAITGAALLAAGAFAMWYFLFRDKPDTDAEANQPSLAWLKGDLNAKGVLVDENNEAVDLTLHFEGEDGKGKSFIVTPRQTCTGDVVARQQQGNQVSFAMGALKCPDGHDYEPFTMTCLRGQNECTGTNRNGESWRLNVDF